jgi:hypothetical protein
MSEELETTPAEEVNSTENASSEAQGEAEGQTIEETIGEVLQPKRDDAVPLSKFLELKTENKRISKEMKELKKAIEEGATKKEISSDIKALSEKHNVDAEFLEDFAKAVKTQAKQEAEDEVTSKLKPIEEKERAEKINKAFEEHYGKAIAQVPEYEGVVSKEVIKQLSLNPANSKKTFIQLIEESYGHLVQGKRSFDSATTRPGKDDNLEVDADKMQKDPAYFKSVMENPTLKQKYNDAMTERLRGVL